MFLKIRDRDLETVEANGVRTRKEFGRTLFLIEFIETNGAGDEVGELFFVLLLRGHVDDRLGR